MSTMNILNIINTMDILNIINTMNDQNIISTRINLNFINTIYKNRTVIKSEDFKWKDKI